MEKWECATWPCKTPNKPPLNFGWWYRQPRLTNVTETVTICDVSAVSLFVNAVGCSFLVQMVALLQFGQPPRQQNRDFSFLSLVQDYTAQASSQYRDFHIMRLVKFEDIFFTQYRPKTVWAP